MPALLCRPSRRDALSFFTQAESAPITPTHPSVALPCRAIERWIDRVKSVAVTCDAQGRVQRYLSGSLNDTRTPSRSKELIEAVGKVIRVVGVTVNEAVGVPRPMTIMAALLFTAEIPMFAPTSVLKAPVPPVTPIPAAGEGWEVVLVTRAYRMPGNGEAPIFWSRLQTPDSEKKRPARCAESRNCLSRQTLRFNKQSIYGLASCDSLETFER